jgi:hypothetical protein
VHVLTDDELRFLLKRCVQKLTPAILRDLRGSSEKRDMALEIAATTVFDHLKGAGHRVIRPERRGADIVDGGGIG